MIVTVTVQVQLLVDVPTTDPEAAVRAVTENWQTIYRRQATWKEPIFLEAKLIEAKAAGT